MTTIAVIPARMESTRFPGKPMAKIHGIPMIGHVHMRTALSTSVDETYTATCNQEIYDYILSIGGKAVMTASTHERCTDRTAEALEKIEAINGNRIDSIVMVQGDEPMIHPKSIDEVLAPLRRDPLLQVANLMIAIKTEQDFEDPNAVKLVLDNDSYALYFSREPIPSRRKWDGAVPMYKQLGIIAFRRDYLLKFNQLTETPLEQIESVDMMRILEHGEKIKMVLTEHKLASVDTPDDLKRVITLIASDPLMRQYAAIRNVPTNY